MKKSPDDRQRFLAGLLDYADKSDTFNPHFHKKELMETLGVTEKEFNIMQKRLGDKYCRFVDQRDGDDRYMITVSACLSLQEQYDEAKKQEQRHRELVRLAILVTLLGAVLGAALVKWLL